MAKEAISYDKAELRAIVRSFKAMDEEALTQAKQATSELATYVQGKIKATASSRTRNLVDNRVADGSKVSKSSKIGEISFGFAGQFLIGL
jgi:hypothetical protein